MNRWGYGLGILLLVLGACGGEEGQDPSSGSEGGAGGKADAVQTSIPTLMFDKSWKEWATGPIVAGGKVRVDYDEARLPDCRASHNGNPGWQITAYLYFLPQKTQVSADLFAHPMTSTGPDYYGWVKQIPELDVPVGTTEVRLWFKNVSGFDNPCEAWDSDYGKNYRFPVLDAPPIPTLTFGSDWSVEQEGSPEQGGKLRVVYDTERLQKISIGNASYSFFASKYHCYGYGCCSHEYYYRLNVRFDKTAAFVGHELEPGKDVTLDIPVGATRVELYFDATVWTTTWYCGGSLGPKYTQPTPDLFYDSAYGKNFTFVVK